MVDGNEEEIAGMGMAMEERRHEAVYVRVYTYETTMSAAAVAGATLSLLWHRSTTHNDFLSRLAN